MDSQRRSQDIQSRNNDLTDVFLLILFISSLQKRSLNGFDGYAEEIRF